jgi:hypothetical protein
MTRLLPVATAFVVLLFSGVVHGVWTDRWADGGDLNEAAAKLENLPLTVGDWKGHLLPQVSRKGGGLAGAVSCRYVHVRTGKEVTVFLACGRPGPVSIHTPDVCYTASGYKMEAKQQLVLPPGSPAAGAAFFTARGKRTRSAEQTRLRIFWSWNAGGKWEVAENPRFTFDRSRTLILYKLYVLREMAAASEPLNEDPCLDLMRQLLPALQPAVLPAS